jgi:hypothetical protein
MASIIKLGPVPLAKVKGHNDYSSMYHDVAALQIGDTFRATFTGRYSASLSRRTLGHYARNKCGFQVESHQRGPVLEIKRTA